MRNRYRLLLFAILVFFLIPFIASAQSEGDGLLEQAQAAYDSGDLAGAFTLFGEARSTYEGEGNREGVAHAYMGEALILLEQEDYITSRSRYSNALFIFRDELGDGGNASRAARGIASTYTVQGNTGGDAETFLREALRQAAGAGDFHEEGISALALGDLFMARREPNQAIDFYNTANSRFFGNGDYENQAVSLMLLGDAYFFTWQMESAIRSYNQAAALYEIDLQQPVNQARAMHRVADVQQHRGDIRAALESYNIVLPLYLAAGDVQGQGLVLAEQANIYRQFGYTQALPQLEEALRLLQQAGDNVGRAKVLNYIGEVYLDREEYQQAYNRFDQALAIAVQSDDDAQEGHAQHGLARVYDRSGNIGNDREALNNFDFALRRFREELSDPYNSRRVFISKALYFQRREQYSDADSNFFQGINEATGVGDQRGEAEAYIIFAEAQFERRNNQEAINYYLRALPISTAIGDAVMEGEIHLAIGRLNLLAAEYTAAREQFELAYSAFNSADDPANVAIALAELGRIQILDADYAGALDSFTEAQQMVTGITGEFRNQLLIDETRSAIFQGLGETYLELGLYQQAQQQLQQAQSLNQQLQDDFSRATTLMILGNVYFEQGQARQAQASLEEAQDLAERLGNQRADAYAKLGLLRVIGADSSQPPREIQLAYDAALAGCRQLTDARCVQLAHLYRGDIETVRGNLEDAIFYYSSALNEANLSLDTRGQVVAHLRLGVVYRINDDFFGAVSAWNNAASLANRIGDTLREGEALKELGDIHLTRSQYERSLEFYTQRLIAYQAAGLRIREGLAYVDIGRTNQQQGKTAIALENYNLALDAVNDFSYQDPLQATSFRDEAIAVVLRHRGDLFRVLGQYNPAADDLARAESLQNSVQDNQELAYTLVALGELDLALSEYGRAQERFRNALRLAEEYNDPLVEALAKYGIARVLTADDDPTNTRDEEENYQQALALARGEASNPVLARDILRSLAISYLRQNDIEQAEIWFQTARNEAREAQDPISEAYALIDIGDLRVIQVRYREALEHYNQALPLFGRSDDYVGEAEVMRRIGDLQLLQVNYTAAIEQYQRMVLLYTENDDTVRRALALSLMGDVYREQALYAFALNLQLDALDILLEIDPATTDQTEQLLFDSTQARIKRNLATVQIALGQYAPARINLEESLNFSIEIGNRLEEGIVLQLLGNLDVLQADYFTAVERYQQAETIFRAFNDTNRLGALYLDLGDAYYSLGVEQENAWFNYGTDANLAYQAALREARRNIEQLNLTLEVQALHRLGRVQTRLNEIGTARANFVTALEKARQAENDVVTIAVLVDLGVLEEREGNLNEAIAAYEEAIELIENVHSGIREESGQISFIAQNILPYHRMVAVQARQNPEQAFAFSERGRSRTFLFHLNNEQVDFGENADVQLLTEWREALAEIADLRSQRQDLILDASFATTDAQTAQIDAELENIARRIDFLNGELEGLEGRISAQSTVLAQFTKVSTITLDEVQAELPDDTLMLSYYVVPPSAVDNGQILVFMVGQDYFEVQSLTSSPNSLENLIIDRAYLTQPDAFLTLHSTLFLPIAEDVAATEASNLVIVPHGILNYLPFGALTPDNETVLNEDYTLRYIQSATVFAALGAAPPPVSNPTALIIGNPIIPDGSLPQLPAAEREAIDVANILGTQSYVQTQATETLVRDRAGSADIIHIAAHGVFLPGNPLSTNLALTRDATQDGQLQVREIYSLPLRDRSPLVVLSACNTVTGELAEGDEFQGLTRAFLLSGARGVVASLWQVDDAATSALMVRFYENRNAGMSDAEALRDAQNYVRSQEQWAAPRFWAAFILVG